MLGYAKIQATDRNGIPENEFLTVAQSTDIFKSPATPAGRRLYVYVRSTLTPPAGAMPPSGLGSVS